MRAVNRFEESFFWGRSESSNFACACHLNAATRISTLQSGPRKLWDFDANIIKAACINRTDVTHILTKKHLPHDFHHVLPDGFGHEWQRTRGTHITLDHKSVTLWSNNKLRIERP